MTFWAQRMSVWERLPNWQSFGKQISFQVGNAKLIEVKKRGSESSVSAAIDECIPEMLLGACTTTGDNRDIDNLRHSL